MKHIKTLTTRDLKESMKKGGCGECQTSCQSACKTSCTVGNQSCEKFNVVEAVLFEGHFLGMATGRECTCMDAA